MAWDTATSPASRIAALKFSSANQRIRDYAESFSNIASRSVCRRSRRFECLAPPLAVSWFLDRRIVIDMKPGQAAWLSATAASMVRYTVTITVHQGPLGATCSTVTVRICYWLYFVCRQVWFWFLFLCWWASAMLYHIVASFHTVTLSICCKTAIILKLFILVFSDLTSWCLSRLLCSILAFQIALVLNAK